MRDGQILDLHRRMELILMTTSFQPSDYPQDTPTPRGTPPPGPPPGSPPARGNGGPPQYGVDLTAEDSSEQALWELAVKRLKAKQEFRGHAVIYVLVNTFLVALWAITGAGFFWPIFPILGWGIGLGAHAWSTFGPSVATREQIEREMERLRRQG